MLVSDLLCGTIAYILLLVCHLIKNEGVTRTPCILLQRWIATHARVSVVQCIYICICYKLDLRCTHFFYSFSIDCLFPNSF